MQTWQVVAVLAVVGVVAAALYSLRAIAGLAAGVAAALRRPRTWVVGVPSMLVVLLIGVPFVYLRATEATPPPPLSFADLPLVTGATATTSTTVAAPASTETLPTVALVGPTAPSGAVHPSDPSTTAAPPAAARALSAIAGPWTVARGTEVRYNIDDTVMGQTSKVVGRTSQVSGTMQVADQTVTAVQVIVDMRTVSCGCVHDSKYHDLMDTDQYPTSSFVLTTPIALSSIPAEGAVIKVPVTGRFTIHGTTRTVSFTLSALRRSGTIAVNAIIPVQLGDYGIESPNAGALGGLSNAEIELLVAFRPGT
jgi:polyisoprenoid-binding protein YceI